MDSNLAVLIVLCIYWLAADRKLSLCAVIISYYALYIVSDLTKLDGYFSTDLYTALGTYCVQLSIDALILVCVVMLSMFNQQHIVSYATYGVVVSTSFLLNGLMLYEQVLDLSTIYVLHAIRQEFSIPIDVLFAVLGSARDDRQGFVDYLRTCYGSIYNRLNRYF